MKKIFFIFFILSNGLQSQEKNLGIFSASEVIGLLSEKGSSNYDLKEQAYYITTGGSAQKSFSEDFQYLYKNWLSKLCPILGEHVEGEKAIYKE